MGDNEDDGLKSIFSSSSCQSYTTWAVHEARLIEPGELPTKEQAIALIDEFYGSKTPLFTKKAIGELAAQLKTQITAGDTIITKDLTGVSLEWKVKVGKSTWLRSYPDTDIRNEWIYKAIGINYNSKAQLKSDLDWKEVENTVYSPLSLMHRICRVDSNSENKDTIHNHRIEERDVVAQDFQSKILAWEESETCKNFKSILSSFASGHDINKIVGLACGSLALPENDSAASQTALLVTVRNWLKERDSNINVSCYIQDPMNTPVDKEVLADVGFEMIDDPRGWLEVDEQSVVLSVAPNVPVKEIIADIARPAIVIWNRVKDEEENVTDPNSARVRAMMEGYDLHEFGSDEEKWSNVVIYIRKSEVAPIPDEDGTF
ncbi:unnamed protein product [Penicillium salamii]|uniref:SRR1-like domain-containing protein n=1 Tax=Penicillium salamii TaxID=1612424 RepID=A0A9W4JHB8_9EURO|nr:unnamed protein product [Penicillium salamii]CAG8074339.1 unnamed protein product [Penicillium salamii]CAG8121924.1 unnamed protein product [Penicillium salamii]CAG8134994.1 unnamed protein product [Penicillium salamii]CAG8301992.1 unnamed protein product [Penicillium salamii]